MKPKKLNLQEITRIYLLLKSALGDKEEDDLWDEISKIIRLASPEALLECIYVLYDNKPEIHSVLEFNNWFAKGLLENEFFAFVNFIRGLDGSSK